MRLHRVAGVLLVVLAFSAVPFAKYANVAWGFLALALGLVGVALLFHTPRPPSPPSESIARGQSDISYFSGSHGFSDSPSSHGQHSSGGGSDLGGDGGGGGGGDGGN
jgi:hypothetical protein